MAPEKRQPGATAVRLRAEGLTYAEIGERLGGVTRQAVAEMLARAAADAE